MSQQSAHDSSYDKNLRSLLDALAMLEQEAGVLLDRFGFDGATVGRVAGVFGVLSGELLRPLAASLGLADASALESLARDVRSLLEGGARLRREQVRTQGEVERLDAALKALEGTTRVLAGLQGRTQSRLEALATSASALERTAEQRARLFEDVSRLRERLDRLEAGLASRAALENKPVAAAVKRASTRRASIRSAEPAAGKREDRSDLAAVEATSRPA